MPRDEKVIIFAYDIWGYLSVCRFGQGICSTFSRKAAISAEKVPAIDSRVETTVSAFGKRFVKGVLPNIIWEYKIAAHRTHSYEQRFCVMLWMELCLRRRSEAVC